MERLCPLVDSRRDAIRDELTFGGILRAFLPAWLHLLKLGKHKLRVLSHLAVCGTPALRANLFDCPRGLAAKSRPMARQADTEPLTGHLLPLRLYSTSRTKLRGVSQST
jgi:hypothetical protein